MHLVGLCWRWIICLLMICLLIPTLADGKNTPQQGYWSPAAAVFDLTIAQFREQFNQHNPALTLAPFRAMKTADSDPLLRAASPINDTLYASTALERGTLNIKSMQITWLHTDSHTNDTRNDALAYITALMRFFSPGLSVSQSDQQLAILLTYAEKQPCVSQTADAVRYTLVTDAEKNITFAIDPLKLALPGSLNK